MAKVASCILLIYQEENDMLKLQNYPGLPLHVGSKLLHQGEDLPSHLAKALLHELKRLPLHFQGYWMKGSSEYHVILRKHDCTDYLNSMTRHAIIEHATDNQIIKREKGT
ncbi:hypothetical protein N7478_003341 [Penicillium angulare]|uniref:uncharacterized protein n=1 Tax=Penicillium angulare TaxID=116970 RepID=UPI002540C4DA|nr:uncharacterized protein N7478_003341 [Penicillium angulare]KAJ5287655.1 hypothetical protein N7478_003341 [Penicillium angulare]